MPSLSPKWCCAAPQLTPARRLISAAVARWKPSSETASTAAAVILPFVSAVRSAWLRRLRWVLGTSSGSLIFRLGLL